MCTRVLWNNNDLAVYVGRSNDWHSPTGSSIMVFPRGIERNGGLVGSQTVVEDNPATWTSKYGSMVTTMWDIATIDGFNEQGLGVHMLMLHAADYGSRDASKPGVHAGVWGQMLLDNAATVEEALEMHDTFQVVEVEAHGQNPVVHLAIEDASGDSAVVEYLDGKLVIHHGRDYKVVTNDPTYDEQLELLAQQDFYPGTRDPGTREMPIPGNTNPVDRFQRVSYFSSLLPEPEDERQAVADMFALTRNASDPFGVPFEEGTTINTRWRTATNLTDKRYYFELTTSPNVIWVELDKFDLGEDASKMRLDPDDIGLCGDVSAKFEELEKVPY